MSILAAFTRLSCKEFPIAARTLFTGPKLLVRLTPTLCAEPLKKKKKLDPQIVKQREDRRRKKIEKQIRRLERNSRQLKPVDELEVPLELIDGKKKRMRTIAPLSEEIIEERALLQKEWARYKTKENAQNYQIVDRLVQSQEKALAELRKESEELYEEAIQPDLQLVPFTAKGPVSTPPIENYDSPDGEYIDISRKWT